MEAKIICDNIVLELLFFVSQGIVLWLTILLGICSHLIIQVLHFLHGVEVLGRNLAFLINPVLFKNEAPLKATERNLPQGGREKSDNFVGSKYYEKVIFDSFEGKVEGQSHNWPHLFPKFNLCSST